MLAANTASALRSVIRFNQVRDIADPSLGDDGDVNCFSSGAGQRRVETLFRTVPVHTGKQDFARAAFLHFDRPFHRIQIGRIAPAVGKDFPACVFRVGGFGIDGGDDGLRTEKSGGFVNQVGTGNGGGVDADLVRDGIEQAADVGNGAYAAADGQRDEDLSGNFFDDVQDGVAVVG